VLQIFEQPYGDLSLFSDITRRREKNAQSFYELRHGNRAGLNAERITGSNSCSQCETNVTFVIFVPFCG
jgi:hypothetical protein